MSSSQCRTCKNVGFCTFPRNRVITCCEEFEDMDTAPAFDWDLQDLLKLWDSDGSQAEGDSDSAG